MPGTAVLRRSCERTNPDAVGTVDEAGAFGWIVGQSRGFAIRVFEPGTQRRICCGRTGDDELWRGAVVAHLLQCRRENLDAQRGPPDGVERRLVQLAGSGRKVVERVGRAVAVRQQERSLAAGITVGAAGRGNVIEGSKCVGAPSGCGGEPGK